MDINDGIGDTSLDEEISSFIVSQVKMLNW
jgi:hypothetical protein